MIISPISVFYWYGIQIFFSILSNDKYLIVTSNQIFGYEYPFWYIITPNLFSYENRYIYITLNEYILFPDKKAYQIMHISKGLQWLIYEFC